jgi:hypothetical protein
VLVVQPFGARVGGFGGGPAEFGGGTRRRGQSKDGVSGVGESAGGGTEGGRCAGTRRRGDHGDRVTVERCGTDGGGLVGIQPCRCDLLGRSVCVAHSTAGVLALFGPLEDWGFGFEQFFGGVSSVGAALSLPVAGFTSSTAPPGG